MFEMKGEGGREGSGDKAEIRGSTHLRPRVLHFNAKITGMV